MSKLTVLAAALLVPVVRANNVIVVGPAPTQVAEIQAAVDAALDGDVILVKSGTYQSFSLQARSVTIVADVGAVVTINGAIRVRGMLPGQTVVFSGLNAVGRASPNDFEERGFYGHNCAGAIRIQKCSLQAAPTPAGVDCATQAMPGLDVDNCADVSVVDSILSGQVRHPGTKSGAGVRALTSNVSLHGCTVTGGTGGNLAQQCAGFGYFGDGLDGGDAVQLDASTLEAARTTLQGGTGGGNATTPYAYNGNGGDALRLTNASVARWLDTTLSPGDEGASWNCGLCGSCCDFGAPGLVARTDPGCTATSIAGTARRLIAANLARGDERITLEVRGAIGDKVLLVVGSSTTFAFDAVQHGTVLVPQGASARIVPLGLVQANGKLVALIRPPAVPAAGSGARAFLQCALRSTAGTRWLSNPHAFAVLDPSF